MNATISSRYAKGFSFKNSWRPFNISVDKKPCGKGHRRVPQQLLQVENGDGLGSQPLERLLGQNDEGFWLFSRPVG